MNVAKSNISDLTGIEAFPEYYQFDPDRKYEYHAYRPESQSENYRFGHFAVESDFVSEYRQHQYFGLVLAHVFGVGAN